MSGRVTVLPPGTAMPRWSSSGNPLARLVWSPLVWRAWPELLRPRTIQRVPPNCWGAPAGCGRPTTGRARPRSRPTPREPPRRHDQRSKDLPMRRPRNAAPRPACTVPAKVVPTGHPPRSPVRSASAAHPVPTPFPPRPARPLPSPPESSPPRVGHEAPPSRRGRLAATPSAEHARQSQRTFSRLATRSPSSMQRCPVVPLSAPAARSP